jgi:hypothetical protein
MHDFGRKQLKKPFQKCRCKRIRENNIKMNRVENRIAVVNWCYVAHEMDWQQTALSKSKFQLYSLNIYIICRTASV